MDSHIGVNVNVIQCKYHNNISDEKNEWEREAELKGHNNWVRDVAWAPDTGFTTSTIASCCQDGKVFIWQCKDLDKANWDIKVSDLVNNL